MWVNFKLMTAVSVGQFKIVVDIICVVTFLTAT